MYGGDDFERQVTAYIKLVDEAAERATVEKRNVMKEHFLMSCRLEHMFWDQAQTMMQWPQIGEGHEMR